jgi:nitrogen fixation/metabolism regulation signal transduction histidine kinase
MNTERTFLHDISSPLTGLQLSLESVQMILADKKLEDLEECQRLVAVCMEQVARTVEMVKARRNGLEKEGKV